MQDQKKRATLIEAVIASGLIAIGIPTGQLLLPIAAVATGVGSNWVHSLAQRGFEHWRGQWFTDEGVLNHDIAKALSRSFVEAVRQVEHNWKEYRYYRYLERKDPEEAKLTVNGLRMLREEGATVFQQPNQLAQVAQQQEHDRVLGMLYKDEFKTSEYFKPVLEAFYYGYDDNFVTFVAEQLGSEWILRFLEVLKDPGEQGTRAWRACQLLWQKSLMSSIGQIQRTTDETTEAVHWLQAWAQQLTSLPPTERNPIGQDALETIRRSVQAQLDDIQKTLDKTYDTTLDIKDTTLQIITRLDEIAPALAKLQPQPLTATRDRNQQRMLESVRITWIKGVLEHSLHDEAMIALGLEEEPGVLANPWRLMVQEADRPAQALPTETRIAEVYDEAGGALLILGEPGAGKTTLLLELARELLDRAQKDANLPIPVVFNLSSWAQKRALLADWLVEELHLRYQVSRAIGRNWVDNDQLLLLLDGLDEVASAQRSACIQAINSYRQVHPLVQVVVCSRRVDYLSQTQQLGLQRAVVVQPLTGKQIDAYLASIGEQVSPLHVALDNDPVLQQLATTPLMLNILMLTYRSMPLEEITEGGSAKARQEQLLASYAQHMLKRRSAETQYTAQQTTHWLAWLARRMKQHDQTTFYLEQLQPEWLAKSRPVEIYTSLAFALLSFPVAVSVYGLEFGSFLNGLIVGLFNAIIAFFFVWFIETDIRVRDLFPRKYRRKPNTRENKRSKDRSRLITFVTQLLGERAGFAFLSGLLNTLLVNFLIGPFYALVSGLFLAAFLIVLGKFERTIEPAEKLLWSWKSVQEHAVGSLLLGLAIGVLGGVSNAIPYFHQLSVFQTTLYFWLSLGFALGLIIMLMRGFSKDELDKSQKVIKPNQGIRNSLSNSLRLGLSSGALVGVVIFFFYSFVIHNVFRVGYIAQLPQDAAIAYGVSDAVAVAYLFWLINGGFACVQHLVLRVLLWQTKRIPWKYPDFLDYAAERILLRKVGGGYIFMHRLLLDYFAALETTQPPHYST